MVSRAHRDKRLHVCICVCGVCVGWGVGGWGVEKGKLTGRKEEGEEEV